jgi:allophanate hydrolase
MELPKVPGLAEVRTLYASGKVSVADLLAQVSARIDHGDPCAFISRPSAEAIDAAIAALLARAPEPNSLPLWGVPFAVKDNIDVAGLPTTCACPDFSHVPQTHATVVAKLIEAGAICMGKTNLDQFATGLNGTRSPFGAPRSVFDADYISGGSSSGSAIAVASGLVCFALGTDTAGSGRVPAMLNNIVGIKPTPGLVSNTGLVPACASLDCITVFAPNVADGLAVRRLMEGYDAADPWSRWDLPARPAGPVRCIGVLARSDYAFFGDPFNARLYEEAIARSGCESVEIAYAPFREVAALLYEGPWVAERQVAFAQTGLPADALDASVKRIFAGAAGFDAVDTFEALHRLASLRRTCEDQLAKVDALLLPTAPRTFTVEDMMAEPIARNAQLGVYTNFCNLLGLSAIAVPAGFSPGGQPFGVTLVGPALADEQLAPLAQALHLSARCGSGIDTAAQIPPLPEPASEPERAEIAVVGAHLSGMPLNHELLALDARLVTTARTTSDYRLFILPGTTPAKPGLVKAPGGDGPGIEVEIWSMTMTAFGRFCAAIPSPLGIGRIALTGGGEVSGFLCEAWAVSGAEEITRHGGWRTYTHAHKTTA